MESESAKPCVTLSTAMTIVPVGVAVLELEPEDTVTVMASATPASTMLRAADTVVFELTGVGEDTVTVAEPFDAA